MINVNEFKKKQQLRKKTTVTNMCCTTLQNSSKATITQENKRNQCVLHTRFQIQAKLPLRKKATVTIVVLIDISKCKQNSRYARKQTSKTTVTQENKRNQCVVFINVTKFKQNDYATKQQ